MNKIKGTRDSNIFESQIREEIRSLFVAYMNAFNFKAIETPILEPSELYRRSVPESDIVQKEMYDFVDKGKREITLRPEGTAGFIRALVNEKWYATNHLNKYWYWGPMFRYEQPQKGRYRQFNQAGIEFIGEANPFNDAEIIILAAEFLKELNVPYKLKINTLGDNESKQKYQQALKEYFLPYKNELNELNQKRLEKNVLRILDDKEDSQKEFVKNAPKNKDFLNEFSKNYFNKILLLLTDNDIVYEVDDSLVRGLDYYDQTVFEFVLDVDNFAQSTIIGGGRYSKLIQELNGPEMSACGWGFGVDRCLDFLVEQKAKESLNPEEVLVLIGTNQENKLVDFFNISMALSSNFCSTSFINKATKAKKIFEKAKKLNVQFLITNDDYIENEDQIVLKNLATNQKLILDLYDESLINKILDFIEKEMNIEE
ncbi:histidine--tRNA ligase [Mycoplasmopsis gallinarum]|uniref:Histidine--tRNA ligase n=1 Tax=Mycoplasmopsis gallinarum TaxID=29557 RepID=A0A168RP17_9BACT|nr:histidine--tRNA ligase [Mycoplasmopsis gallinarum]OAB49159.1 Histidyl-tRNA synthetase [Mycoplasmopsis gallinarum]